MNNYEEAIRHRLLQIFSSYKKQIFNNWIILVQYNIKLYDDFELDGLTKLFREIIENYINYFSHGSIKEYYYDTLRIADEIANNNISYSNFITTIPFLQESYTHILLKNVSIIDLDRSITLTNRLYNKALTIIRDEYFEIKDSTLTAILELSELRDDDTGKHVERTKDYATVLSKELNLDDNFIKNISKASLLHDIGKVAIRDEILLKPGKLTDSEFEEMKRHTIIGAKTISNVISSNDIKNEYLYMAVDISLCHHEKYDGSGYPNGFAGMQIPLPARIFAIADAYDVITSKRPYKQPLSHEEAVERIVVDSGKHFDPDVVGIFIKNQDKFKTISDKYRIIQQSQYSNKSISTTA